MSVFQGHFSHSCLEPQGEGSLQMALTGAAAQTAEVSSCGVAVTEDHKDHIVWTHS